jgi:carbamoyltransferase
MYTLGISAGHDTSACLMQDGRVLAAVEEERFLRIKHATHLIAGGLPFKGIQYCCKVAGIRPDQIDRVGFYMRPNVTVRRQSAFRMKRFLHGPSEALYYSFGLWNDYRGFLKTLRQLEQLVGGSHKVKSLYHHLCHAASSFLVSPYDEAALLVADGMGEAAAASLGTGRGSRLELLDSIDYPHSLGFLYGTTTGYLGFTVNSDEYKVMGLAPYGKPEFKRVFDDLIRLEPGGRFRLHLDYFSASFRGPKFFSEKFYRALGPERGPDEPVEERHRNIAASLQQRTEEAVFHMANHLFERTRSRNLCYSGGVALNCSLNGKLRENTPFENVWVQPAAGDPGTAVGAAALVYHGDEGRPRDYVMDSAFLGPEYSDAEIEETLDICKVSYERLPSDQLVPRVARLLAEGAIVGWFQGRMEWGPRALGSRSILANPTRADMKDLVNRYVKHREDFRPFAPTVLEERAAEFMEWDRPSPFMLFACRVRPEAQARIPAVTHVNGTARVQTVSRREHPLYYSLIEEFGRLTGVPILLNTSFNVMGEPIVCRPLDAVRCFYSNGLDALAVGSFLLQKSPVRRAP